MSEMRNSFILLLILIVGFLLFYAPKPSNKRDALAIAKYLTQVHDKCYSKVNRNECLSKASLATFKKYNLKDVLTALETIENSKSSANYHDFITFVAREEYKSVKNLPKLFENCTFVYAAACFHGAVAGFVSDLSGKSKEEMKMSLSNTCDFTSGIGPMSKCVHGIGHGLMLLTNGDVFESLKLCDNQKSNLQDCYEGVFMENFPGTSTSDHPIKYVKKDDPFYPCDVLGQAYVSMCYRMLSYSFMAGILPDFTRLSEEQLRSINEYCQRMPLKYKNLCYVSLGDRISRTRFDTPKDLVANCTSPLIADHKSCVLGLLFVIGGRAFSVSELRDLCGALPLESKKECTNAIQAKIESRSE